MSAIQTIADAHKYGLTVAVRCPGCQKDAWVKAGKIPGDRSRSPWNLSFKCKDCGGSAGVRTLLADDCVEEDKRRVGGEA